MFGCVRCILSGCGCVGCTHMYCSRRMEREAKQRSSRLFGDKLYSIPCGASCFGSVHLDEKDEFILLLWVYSQLSAVQLCLMKFLVMCQTMHVVQVNSRKH